MTSSLLTSWLLSFALLEIPAAPVADECTVSVNEFFAGRRYAEAAAAAERCWEETREPSALFFAVQARANLGHGGHAAVALRRYEKAETREWRDPIIDNIFTMVRSMVVSVEVSVTPTPSAEGELAAVYLDERRGVIRISAAELRDFESQVLLDPGRWRLAWREGNRIVTSREIVAAEGLNVVLEIPPSSEVEVEAPPRPAPPSDPWEADRLRRQRRARVGVAAGVGSAATLSLGAGIGLLIHGGQIEAEVLTAKATYADEKEIFRPIVNRAAFMSHGAVLLGSGIGGGIVVATELTKAPRLVLYAEFGAGAALAVAGAVWSARTIAAFEESSQDFYDVGRIPANEAFIGPTRGGVGSGLLLGLGSGLVTGAAISLISRAVAERRRR